MRIVEMLVSLICYSFDYYFLLKTLHSGQNEFFCTHLFYLEASGLRLQTQAILILKAISLIVNCITLTKVIKIFKLNFLIYKKIGSEYGILPINSVYTTVQGSLLLRK